LKPESTCESPSDDNIILLSQLVASIASTTGYLPMAYHRTGDKPL